ncbi:sensor domain-containing protein [Mycobacterium marinum]|uniref:sensor domain-containing protein n=1 Tax=Mycobacterium marinum TaxID=1781 RepID=UPI0035655138
MSDDSWEDELIAQQHYRQLLDHCPDTILVHEKGRIVYLNPAGIAFLGGTSEDQFLGRSIADIVLPEQVHEILARIASLREVGESSGPARETLVRLDGTALEVAVVSVLTKWRTKLAYLVVIRDQRAQDDAERALRYHTALIDRVSDAVIATTAAGTVASWNLAAEAMYRRTSAAALTMHVSDAVGAAFDPTQIVADGETFNATHHDAEGQPLSVRMSVSAVDDGFLLVCADRTAFHQTARHFQTVAASLTEGVVVLSEDGHVVSVNPAALRILGIRRVDVVYDDTTRTAKIPIFTPSGRMLSPRQEALAALLQEHEDWAGCVVGIDRSSDGQRLWLSINGRLLATDGQSTSAMMLSLVDITAQYATRQQLAYEASHDALTGLPNRNALLSQLARDIDGPNSPKAGAVLFIDLDDFKAVNDSIGHGAGDIVLRTVAHRLRAALRASDALGRIGGDEFVAVIHGEATQPGLTRLIQRIKAVLALPLAYDGHELTPRASIGIAVVENGDSRDLGEILRDAESAMYSEKALGKNAGPCWTPRSPQIANDCQACQRDREDTSVVRTRGGGCKRWAADEAGGENNPLCLATAVTLGLERGEFFVEYQPIFRLADNAIIGAEALLRWTHPTRGILLPNDIVELARDSALLAPTAAYVLRQVCSEARNWYDKDTNHQPFVSVNVCAQNLSAPDFLPLVRDVLTASGLPTNALQLELTEHASLSGLQDLIANLEELRTLGVSIAIDDFGTGFSNLTYLRTLPMHMLKLDREFLESSRHGPVGDKQILESVVNLVHKLGVTVVAEGVETAQHADLLRAVGCDAAQGWYFAKPMSADKLREALRRSPSHWTGFVDTSSLSAH